jgi:hypothetical protein
MVQLDQAHSLCGIKYLLNRWQVIRNMHLRNDILCPPGLVWIRVLSHISAPAPFSGVVIALDGRRVEVHWLAVGCIGRSHIT